MSTAEKLTGFARYFLEPRNSSQRLYEALRAFFVEGLPSAQAAHRFGYSPGSFRVLVHRFRQDPERPFFLPPVREARAASKKERLRDRIVTLRKQNLSIYDIARDLKAEGVDFSPVAVAGVLKDEGFARLPRRLDDERPPNTRPTAAAVADVRELDLTPRRFRTRFGGLFLFLPLLAEIPFDRILKKAGLPASPMVPAAHAMRSLLALKLFGTARHSHVMSSVFDDGLALFAGLNVIPKRSFLTAYSSRVDPACYPKLMRHWFEAMSQAGLPRGTSFDLDFHTIPFHGEDAVLEKHYVSKRSRRQKGILAFLAQDAGTRVLCYANARVRKGQQNDEIRAFATFWKQRTGQFPKELIFDSKLTTYANLSWLNRHDVAFITLRRRTQKMIREITARPASAWQRIELKGVSRIYKHPRILERTITLAGYQGSLREIVVADLGHEEPTLLLTNYRRRTAATLVGRYAQRMLIENNIADSIDFFHMDALSSAVAMKVDCDLQLTLMASSLYRLLAARLGDSYQHARSRHLFRDFVEASAQVEIKDREIVVRFQKRAHNPYLFAAGFARLQTPIPWLGGRSLRLVFG